MTSDDVRGGAVSCKLQRVIVTLTASTSTSKFCTLTSVRCPPRRRLRLPNGNATLVQYRCEVIDIVYYCLSSF
jgi:hypothetical protein